MTQKDALLLILTFLFFGLIINGYECLFTICKTVSIPEFLKPLYYNIGNHLISGLLVMIALMLPIGLFCQKHTTGIVAYLSLPVFISLFKLLPEFDPEYDFVNFGFDYLFIFARLVAAFYFWFILRKLITNLNITERTKSN